MVVDALVFVSLCMCVSQHVNAKTQTNGDEIQVTKSCCSMLAGCSKSSLQLCYSVVVVVCFINKAESLYVIMPCND